MSTQKHTPGPWAWFGGKSNFYLATTHSGRRYVMGFRRRGFNSAQPTFQVEGIMVPADELAQFEVGDRGVVGFDQAKRDGSVYRYDVRGFDHPDARLIAASPDMYEALSATLADFEAWAKVRGGAGTYQSAMDRIRAAIAKAEASS